MASVIYQIKNNKDGKIYIGSAVNRRKRFSLHRFQLRRNRHGNNFLQRAWNKHGEENFEFRVLEIVVPEKLIQREQHYLDTLQPFAPNGYNICRTAGSTLGRKRTEAEKKHLSILNKGKKHTVETKLKMSRSHNISNSSHPHTEESKRKIRESRLRNSAIYQTDEYRKKQSEKSKGRIKSEETCRKISETHRGIKKTPEHIAKLLESRYGIDHAIRYKKRIGLIL